MTEEQTSRLAAEASPAASPPPPTALDLAYRPQDPQQYHPRIGLIGCGGITRNHLRAYRRAGYKVAALCDINEANARQRQAEFYPQATVYRDWKQVLRRDDIEVVDIATHPEIRVPIIEASLGAGKHVLSQKPFVLDLDVGQRLAEMAESRGVKLAVNQNGRWAPHFSYAREAIRAGLLGDVLGAHLSVHWDHTWIGGTEFEKVKHLILYDYAIHWFDILRCFLPGEKVIRVHASTARAAWQTVAPAMLAQALIEYEHSQASLAFDAVTPFGQQDRTYIAGSRASIISVGPNHKQQQLTLSMQDGTVQPELEGCWFPDGFHGTMGELLRSVEERREPTISAADNLESLALCFAAIASAEMHRSVRPGEIRRLPS